MEEAGTDDRVDSIGTDDLTPGNAITTIAGKNNLAANFDANNESLIDTGWRAIGFPGFSISAWIKRSGYVTETTAVIVSENAATFQAFTLQAYNAGGYLTCSFRDSTNAIQTASNTTQDAGYTSDWVHVVAAWGTGSAVKLYVDGALWATSPGTLSGATLKDSSAGIVVGSGNALFKPWWGGNAGYIDELAIFDYDIGLPGAVGIYNGGVGIFF